MTEFTSDNHEIRLSTEQKVLVTLARTLITLPDAQEYPLPYEYRDTTTREKAEVLLGRLAGRGRISAAPREGIFQKAQTQALLRVLGLRGLNNDDIPGGAWSGGVYLSQKIVTDFDTQAMTEELSLYAEGTVGNELGGVSEMSAYKDVTAWRINLLKPLESEKFVKAGIELEQAAKRYSLS